MNLTDKEFKQLCMDEASIPCNEEKISKTIQASKTAFYAAQEESSLSQTEFIFQQAKFIKKQWWLLQALTLLGLWLILKFSNSDWSIQRSIGLLSPLFVVMIIPEIWKNRSAESMEIECTTCFSLRQVYAARLILFGIVDLVLLTVFFASATPLGKLSVWELVVQFFVPFNVTGCICFSTLYNKKWGSEAFALMLSGIWIALWAWIVLDEKIYMTISVPAWAALLVLSGACMGYWILRGQRGTQMWEVKPQWN